MKKYCKIVKFMIMLDNLNCETYVPLNQHVEIILKPCTHKNTHCPMPNKSSFFILNKNKQYFSSESDCLESQSANSAL